MNRPGTLVVLLGVGHFFDLFNSVAGRVSSRSADPIILNPVGGFYFGPFWTLTQPRQFQSFNTLVLQDGNR